MTAVPLRLLDVEPDLGPWRQESTRTLSRAVLRAALEGRGRRGGEGPLVVAIDGRSGSGKSTLASELVAATPGTAVVHTDDLAWHEPHFRWHYLLVEGVLGPVSRGDDPAYRPPAWEERGREGGVHVVPGCDVVWVEGVGSGGRCLAAHVDAVVWVQSDVVTARDRGLARDVALGRTEREALEFWQEWGEAEDAYLGDDRPWDRAGGVVLGTTGDYRRDGTWLVSTTREL